MTTQVFRKNQLRTIYLFFCQVFHFITHTPVCVYCLFHVVVRTLASSCTCKIYISGCVHVLLLLRIVEFALELAGLSEHHPKFGYFFQQLGKFEVGAIFFFFLLSNE